MTRLTATLIALACLSGAVLGEPIRADQLLLNRMGPGTPSSIHRLDLTTGAMLQLTDGKAQDFDGCWLLDGTVVFASYDRQGEVARLCRVQADGKQRTTLHEVKGGAIFNPTVSPDGKHIAFMQVPIDGPDDLPQVHIVNSDGSGARAIGPATGSFPAWSPDGASILFVTGNPEPAQRAKLQTMDPQGGSLRVLFAGPDPILDCAWSPDGKRVAFTVGMTLPNGERRTRIEVMNASAGAAPTTLVEGTSICFGPHFSQDGSEVYYNRLTDEAIAIWKVGAGGGEGVKVADGVVGGGVMAMFLSGGPEPAPSPAP
ncbi:MAG: hypothetical protein AB1758_23795 [Candidatus Eremiobacterota bacterium]